MRFLEKECSLCKKPAGLFSRCFSCGRRVCDKCSVELHKRFCLICLCEGRELSKE